MERTGKTVNNFPAALPPMDSDMVIILSVSITLADIVFLCMCLYRQNKLGE